MSFNHTQKTPEQPGDEDTLAAPIKSLLAKAGAIIASEQSLLLACRIALLQMLNDERRQLIERQNIEIAELKEKIDWDANLRVHNRYFFDREFDKVIQNIQIGRLDDKAFCFLWLILITLNNLTTLSVIWPAIRPYKMSPQL